MESTPANQRRVVEILQREFASLSEQLRTITASVPNDLLYRRPPSVTIGENILKSAGIVEQTFGGITANLWDDPFEWTLPETLSTTDHILEYLSEVETTRGRGFASFADDATLLKFIELPSGEPGQLLPLLLHTLTQASDFKGRALATFKMLSDVSS